MILEELPEELVCCVLFKLCDMQTILRVEITCTMMRNLIQQHRTKLLCTTHVRVYGCWKPEQMWSQPFTDAAKQLMNACRRVYGNYADDEQAAAAARNAIANGAHVNAWYQCTYPDGRAMSHLLNPLRMAALNGLAPVVRELLLAGADPNQYYYWQNMPLILQIMPNKAKTLKTKFVAIIKMLLCAGVSEEQRVAAIKTLERMRRRAAELPCFSNGAEEYLPLIRALTMDNGRDMSVASSFYQF